MAKSKELESQRVSGGERYTAAIIEAQDLLRHYEWSGRGTHIWQAYRAAREAAAAFPAHRDALMSDLKKRHPEWQTRELHNSGEVVREVLERVLAHMDRIATDMVALRGLSTPAGVKSLRRALRMDDERSPARAAAYLNGWRIIEEFTFQVEALNLRQAQFNANPARWSFTKVRNNVAKTLGVSGKHVGEVIKSYLEHSPGVNALAEKTFATAKALRPKKATKTKAARPVIRRKQKNRHPWRVLKSEPPS